MITRNVGGADRVVRFVVGLALLLFGLFVLQGPARVAVVALALAALATSLTAFCPAYVPFRISTQGSARHATKAG